MSEKWLLLNYLPVSLFSLRMTHATSKGGKTLLLPSPYAFKMTMIDACFSCFESHEADSQARSLFDLIKGREIRFSPPQTCIVQNTFIKIRQEERDAPKGYFVPTIAYREFCLFANSDLTIAIDIVGLSSEEIAALKIICVHINCIGKRGSFWQHTDSYIHEGLLPTGYTHPISEKSPAINKQGWTQYLDDFGEALCSAKDGFDRISTYGDGKIELGTHRILKQTFVPYSFKRSSRHFTHYEKIVDQ
jgi:hypothetical protein